MWSRVRLTTLPPIDCAQIILDSESWLEHLPGTIQAVFAMSSADDDYKAHARSVHKRFQDEFRVEIPFLLYTHGQEPPFSTFA